MTPSSLPPLSTETSEEPNLSALDAERYLNERAKRGREVDINAILAKVPDTEPEPEDRIGSDADDP